MKVVISVPFDHGFLELSTCEDEVTTETNHLHYVFNVAYGIYSEEIKGEIPYEFGEDVSTLMQKCVNSYTRITFAVMKKGLADNELSIH